MNTTPAVFSFESHPVRSLLIDDAPWFVAADVCAALEIQNVSQALAQHTDADERAIFKIGRQGDTNIINESGLYSLILGSRKAEAKKFKKWVTAEVLPAIRKTGRYEHPASRSAQPNGLTAEHQDIIKAAVNQRLEELPPSKRAIAARVLWSSLSAKFGVKSTDKRVAHYKLIPDEGFNECLSLIARTPLEGELQIGNTPSPQPADQAQAARQLLLHSRFLVGFDRHGYLQLQEVPTNAAVFAPNELPRYLSDPGSSVDLRCLTEIISACAQRLALRSH